ncbi:MAG: nucleotide exchange factor GrpE [Actinomycetaceae bacterium]|nr:nucleotide exchange factor GrpE [Actinomycetaceae bacterium]
MSEELNHDPLSGDREDGAGADQPVPAGSDASEQGSQPADLNDISHLEDQLSDLDGEQNVDDPALLREELAKQGDELARARADYYNLTQTHNNYVRRSKADMSNARKMGQGEVVEALMPVLDDIAAAREAGALAEGPFAAIANKLDQVLQSRFGLERFGAAGDEFDPTIHEAVMAQPSAEVQVETVFQVVQAGYRTGDKVLRAAKVIVSNPL